MLLAPETMLVTLVAALLGITQGAGIMERCPAQLRVAGTLELGQSGEYRKTERVVRDSPVYEGPGHWVMARAESGHWWITTQPGEGLLHSVYWAQPSSCPGDFESGLRSGANHEETPGTLHIGTASNNSSHNKNIITNCDLITSLGSATRWSQVFYFSIYNSLPL